LCIAGYCGGLDEECQRKVGYAKMPPWPSRNTAANATSRSRLNPKARSLRKRNRSSSSSASRNTSRATSITTSASSTTACFSRGRCPRVRRSIRKRSGSRTSSRKLPQSRRDVRKKRPSGEKSDESTRIRPAGRIGCRVRREPSRAAGNGGQGAHLRHLRHRGRLSKQHHRRRPRARAEEEPERRLGEVRGCLACRLRAVDEPRQDRRIAV